MSRPEHDSPRWKVWPAIFLLCVIALIWFIATHVQNTAQAGLIIFAAIVLFGIAQRLSVYLRRGRPTL